MTMYRTKRTQVRAAVREMDNALRLIARTDRAKAAMSPAGPVVTLDDVKATLNKIYPRNEQGELVYCCQDIATPNRSIP